MSAEMAPRSSSGGFGAKRYSRGAALVSGGSGGLGRASCLALARAGSDIALTYRRNRQSAEALVADIEALGRRAWMIPVDLLDAAAVAREMAGAEERAGGLHTIVSAAGPFIDMLHVSRISPDLFRATVGDDLFGFYNLVHCGLPALRRSGGGLVALVSAAIRRYAKTDILSVAPKAAVESVVRAIALEEGRHGIRANSVGVGLVADGMFHELKARGGVDEKWLAAAQANLSVQRLGTADDIADAVAFLASDRASYITGQLLCVDGGFSA